MNIIGNKGIVNLGNTCYMNSILQCLIHLPQLQIKKLKKEYHKNNILVDKKLIDQWIILQNMIWNKSNDKRKENVINPRTLLTIFIQKCKENDIYFESFNQNDALEFLNIFIELLHDCLKRKITVSIEGKVITQYDKLKMKSIESWKTFFLNNYSYIIEQFYSESITFTSCPECEYYTTNHEQLMTIILTQNNGFETLYDCLNEYIKKDKLDDDNQWLCDKCCKKTCPCKKTIFWNLSPILIFQIKQYTNFNKLDEHIDFPINLDMEEYCINLNKDESNYKLLGTCNQIGNLNYGHYNADCLNINDNKWYHYDDEHVSLISKEDVLKKNPYCLFYIKC